MIEAQKGNEEEEGLLTTRASKGGLLVRSAELTMAWMQQTPKGALKSNGSCKAALSAFVPH